MKHLFLISFALLIACGDDNQTPQIKAFDPNQIQSHNIYLFGDSISTDTPITYGRLLKDELTTLSVTIGGVGGNRVIELINRLDRDVVANHPDTIVILVGINDAFTHCGAPEFFDPTTFRNLYSELLNEIHDKLPNVRLILVSPAVIADPNREALPANTHLQCLIDSIGDYQQVVENLSQQYNVEFADFGKLIRDAMQTHLPSELSSDGIHPNQYGASLLKNLLEQKIVNNN